MNIPQTIFISDVHLGAGTPKEERARESMLIGFLRSNLQQNDRLVIVGDLFDFWFEYRHAMPKQFINILACLKELSESGVRIDYVAGNHDFWVGSFFTEELGLRFHPEPVELVIEGKKVFVMHGDGLKKSDGPYRIMKKIFRSKLNIWLYRWLHPDIGIPFAKWISGFSREHTSKKDYGGNEEYFEFAERKLLSEYDFVVMGHTHDPVLKRFDVAKAYLNLGDWLENFSYGKLVNGELSLEHYRADSA